MHKLNKVPYKEIIDELNFYSFNKNIIANKESAVVVFGVEWSGKSEMVLSMIAEYSKYSQDKVNFYRIDSENEKDLCQSIGINFFPTLVFYKEGVIVESVQGLLSSIKLEAKLAQYYLAKAS